MPTSISCPACRRPLEIPEELLGRSVQCPACGKTFVAHAEVLPVVASAADPFDFDAAPPEPEINEFALPPEAERDPRRWRRVHLGITFLLIAVAIFITSSLGSFCSGGVVWIILGSAYISWFSKVVVLMLASGMLLSVLLTWIGQAFCLAVPRRHGARLLGILSLLFSLLGFVLPFVAVGFIWWSAHREEPSDSRIAYGLLNATVLVYGIELLTFLFFLRAVALCLKDWPLARSVFYLLVLGGTIVLATVALVIMSLIESQAHQRFEGGLPQNIMEDAGVVFLNCANLMLVMGAAVWCVLLLMQVREALARHIRLLAVKQGERVM